MSSSFVKDCSDVSAPGNPSSGKTVIIIVNNETGNISLDEGELQNILASHGAADSSQVSVVRMGGGGLGTIGEINSQIPIATDGTAHVNLTVEGFPAIPVEGQVEGAGQYAELPLDADAFRRLESVLDSEEAREILGEPLLDMVANPDQLGTLDHLMDSSLFDGNPDEDGLSSDELPDLKSSPEKRPRGPPKRRSQRQMDKAEREEAEKILAENQKKLKEEKQMLDEQQLEENMKNLNFISTPQIIQATNDKVSETQDLTAEDDVGDDSDAETRKNDKSEDSLSSRKGKGRGKGKGKTKEVESDKSLEVKGRGKGKKKAEAESEATSGKGTAVGKKKGNKKAEPVGPNKEKGRGNGKGVDSQTKDSEVKDQDDDRNESPNSTASGVKMKELKVNLEKMSIEPTKENEAALNSPEGGIPLEMQEGDDVNDKEMEETKRREENKKNQEAASEVPTKKMNKKMPVTPKVMPQFEPALFSTPDVMLKAGEVSPTKAIVLKGKGKSMKGKKILVVKKRIKGSNKTEVNNANVENSGKSVMKEDNKENNDSEKSTESSKLTVLTELSGQMKSEKGLLRMGNDSKLDKPQEKRRMGSEGKSKLIKVQFPTGYREVVVLNSAKAWLHKETLVKVIPPKDPPREEEVVKPTKQKGISKKGSPQKENTKEQNVDDAEEEKDKSGVRLKKNNAKLGSKEKLTDSSNVSMQKSDVEMRENILDKKVKQKEDIQNKRGLMRRGGKQRKDGPQETEDIVLLEKREAAQRKKEEIQKKRDDLLKRREAIQKKKELQKQMDKQEKEEMLEKKKEMALKDDKSDTATDHMKGKDKETVKKTNSSAEQMGSKSIPAGKKNNLSVEQVGGKNSSLAKKLSPSLEQFGGKGSPAVKKSNPAGQIVGKVSSGVKKSTSSVEQVGVKDSVAVQKFNLAVEHVGGKGTPAGRKKNPPVGHMASQATPAGKKKNPSLGQVVVSQATPVGKKNIASAGQMVSKATPAGKKNNQSAEQMSDKGTPAVRKRNKSVEQIGGKGTPAGNKSNPSGEEADDKGDHIKTRGGQVAQRAVLPALAEESPLRRSGRAIKKKTFGDEMVTFDIREYGGRGDMGEDDDEEAMITDEEEEDSADDYEEDDPERLWCICQKPHNNRFMICCDKCEDWFHGTCVGISKQMGQQMEELGEEWVCPKCKKAERAMKGLPPTVKKVIEPIPVEVSSPVKTRRSDDAGKKAVAHEVQTLPEKLPDQKKTGSQSSRQVSDDETHKDNQSTKKSVTSLPDTVVASSNLEKEKKCVVESCKNTSKCDSVYCSNECVLIQAKMSLKLLGINDEELMVQNVPGASASAANAVNEPRVLVVQKSTGKIIAGSGAPTIRQLKDWLKDHPDFTVLQPGMVGSPGSGAAAAAAVNKTQAGNTPIGSQKKIIQLSSPSVAVPIPGAAGRKVTVVKSADGRIIVKASEPVVKEHAGKIVTTMASRPNETKSTSESSSVKSSSSSNAEISSKVTVENTVKSAAVSSIKEAAESTVKTATVNSSKTAPENTVKTSVDSSIKISTESSVKASTVNSTKAAVTSGVKAAVQNTVKISAGSPVGTPAKVPPMSPVKTTVVGVVKSTDVQTNSGPKVDVVKDIISSEKKDEASSKVSSSKEAKKTLAKSPVVEKKVPDPTDVRNNIKKTLAECLISRSKDAKKEFSHVTEVAIKEIALDIEKELYQYFGKDIGFKYKARYRSLLFNIRDPKNSGLFRKILNKTISPSSLAKMTPEELASKELAEWREREEKKELQAIEKHELDMIALGNQYIMKSHKGEIEIDKDEFIKDKEKAPETLNALPTDPVMELLGDTSAAHKNHVYDLNCKICTGKDQTFSQDKADKDQSQASDKKNRDHKHKGPHKSEESKDGKSSDRERKERRDSSDRDRHRHKSKDSDRDKKYKDGRSKERDKDKSREKDSERHKDKYKDRERDSKRDKEDKYTSREKDKYTDKSKSNKDGERERHRSSSSKDKKDKERRESTDKKDRDKKHKDKHRDRRTSKDDRDRRRRDSEKDERKRKHSESRSDDRKRKDSDKEISYWLDNLKDDEMNISFGDREKNEVSTSEDVVFDSNKTIRYTPPTDLETRDYEPSSTVVGSPDIMELREETEILSFENRKSSSPRLFSDSPTPPLPTSEDYIPPLPSDAAPPPPPLPESPRTPSLPDDIPLSPPLPDDDDDEDDDYPMTPPLPGEYSPTTPPLPDEDIPSTPPLPDEDIPFTPPPPDDDDMPPTPPLPKRPVDSPWPVGANDLSLPSSSMDYPPHLADFAGDLDRLTPPPLGDKSGSSSTPTEPQSVWKGAIQMPEVAKFFASAFEVSGKANFLPADVPSTIEVFGRIAPDTVWNYIAQMKKSGSKEILVVRFQPANEEEKISYIALYSYLSNKKRYAVIGNCEKSVKDFYIVPLASHQPIPQVLLPLDGPGFEEHRAHMLIGVIVHGKQKRVYDHLTGTWNIANSQGTPQQAHSGPNPHGKDLSERSYTPPLPTDEDIQEIALAAKDSDDELEGIERTYTPPPKIGDKESVASFDTKHLKRPSKEPSESVQAKKPNLSLESPRMESKDKDDVSSPSEFDGSLDQECMLAELNRQIEEHKKELSEMQKTIGNEEEEPYSPSGDHTPPSNEELKLDTSKIVFPSNLQEILDNIKRKEAEIERKEQEIQRRRSLTTDPIVMNYGKYVDSAGRNRNEGNPNLGKVDVDLRPLLLSKASKEPIHKSDVDLRVLKGVDASKEHPVDQAEDVKEEDVDLRVRDPRLARAQAAAVMEAIEKGKTLSKMSDEELLAKAIEMERKESNERQMNSVETNVDHMYPVVQPPFMQPGFMPQNRPMIPPDMAHSVGPPQPPGVMRPSPFIGQIGPPSGSLGMYGPQPGMPQTPPPSHSGSHGHIVHGLPGSSSPHHQVDYHYHSGHSSRRPPSPVSSQGYSDRYSDNRYSDNGWERRKNYGKRHWPHHYDKHSRGWDREWQPRSNRDRGGNSGGGGGGGGGRSKYHHKDRRHYDSRNYGHDRNRNKNY